MWLLWVCILFVPSSAFPFGDTPQHYHGLLEFGEWPDQRPSLCLPSPFFGQICLPSIFRLLSPMRSVQVKRQGCVSIPLMTEYVVKLCSSNETTKQGENFRETQKEIIKEQEEEEEVGEKEKEPEAFSDNAIVKVHAKEDEPEKFVEKENKDKSESQLEQDENDVRNKIIQLSEEIVRLNSPEPSPLLDDEEDENVSITSNLV